MKIIRVVFVFLFALGILLTNETSYAQQISASSFLTVLPTESIIAGAQAYAFNAVRLHESLAAHRRLEIAEFPITPTENIVLDIKPGRSPIDARTECWLSSPSGDVRIATPEIILYRGKVRGEPNSHVTMVSSATSLFCSIIRESGMTYVLAPEKNQPNSGVHILMAENDLLASQLFSPFTCISDDIKQPTELRPVDEILEEFRASHKQDGGRTMTQGVSKNLTMSTLLQPDIAIEADNVFYNAAGGNPAMVLAYIGAVFGMSSTIYEDEANITFHISWVKLWDTPDPYNCGGNAYALEDTVPKYWKSHYQTVQRDLAHVLTSIGYGGGGYGLLSLCSNDYSYSMSSPKTKQQYPTFAFTYDSYIVAHEIGHNFGLPHSHSCYWNPPLDTCYTRGDPQLSIGDACDTFPITPRPSAGSIMSYCANANYTLSGNNFANFKLAMTFTPRVDTVLRANAEKTVCITEPIDPTLILLSPRGSESFPGDTSYQITWTSAHIQQVNLDYSPDGGGLWTRIASGIPASPAGYLWKVPNITSTKMLVRVYDATVTGVGDTSLLFFSTKASSSVVAAKATTSFSVTPNPASAEISIEGADVRRVIVRDILGHEQTGITTSYASGKVRLDLSHLESGTYIVTVETGDGRHSARFVKK